MKKVRLFLIFFLLIYKSVSALTIDELYQDLKSLPIERISPLPSLNKGLLDKREKLKAVQIFVLPEREKWGGLLDSFKRGGVNTLIIRVFHNKGDRYHCNIKTAIKEGVYFRSKYLPTIDDILMDFCEVAKSKGFMVFAWMTTRYADYGRNDLKKVKAYSFENKEFYDSRGINIFDKYNQEFIKLVFKELASYPINGILLQDDLFFRHNEGFLESSDDDFYNLTGIKPTPSNLYINRGGKITYTDLFYNWRRFKSKKIAVFIKDLKDNIREVNPHIKLAVNLTYEAISHPTGALLWLSHNLEDLKEVSDYFSLMAYHRQIMDELKIDIGEVKNYISDMIKRCEEVFPEDKERIIFKLQIKDWKTNEAIPKDEILNLISWTKGLKGLSIAIVPYPPDIPEIVMRSIFE